jgi:hypothetical protein
VHSSRRLLNLGEVWGRRNADLEPLRDLTLLSSASISEHILRPEFAEAMTAMERVWPLAQELAIGDLHCEGTPEALELLEAVMTSVADWDAAMRDDGDSYEDE